MDHNVLILLLNKENIFRCFFIGFCFFFFNRNAGEPVKRRPTNNVGEIEACTRAIQIANSAGIKKLLINTDSEFTINCITKWIHGWKKKNWVNAAGKPVINKDELMELDENLKLMDDIKWVNYLPCLICNI